MQNKSKFKFSILEVLNRQDVSAQDFCAGCTIFTRLKALKTSGIKIYFLTICIAYLFQILKIYEFFFNFPGRKRIGITDRFSKLSTETYTKDDRIPSTEITSAEDNFSNLTQIKGVSTRLVSLCLRSPPRPWKPNNGFPLSPWLALVVTSGARIIASNATPVQCPLRPPPTSTMRSLRPTMASTTANRPGHKQALSPLNNRR